MKIRRRKFHQRKNFWFEVIIQRFGKRRQNQTSRTLMGFQERQLFKQNWILELQLNNLGCASSFTWRWRHRIRPGLLRNDRQRQSSKYSQKWDFINHQRCLHYIFSSLSMYQIQSTISNYECLISEPSMQCLILHRLVVDIHLAMTQTRHSSNENKL